MSLYLIGDSIDLSLIWADVLSLAIFSVFVFYPFFKNFYLGFYRTPPFPGLPQRFVGFDQYREILTSSYFTNSMRVTITFAILTVPTGIVLGLLLAVLANQQLRGIGWYRTIFSSTVATSVAVASVIFGTLLNPQVGLLPWLGITTNPSILDNPRWALLAVAVTTIWQNLGLSFIVMSSGLQAIPDEIMEASEVDGAGPVRRFVRVTLPLLSPTVFFAVVVGSIVAFQSFGQIDLLTQGGPIQKTNVLTYAIYQALRGEQNEGKAAVLAVALFLVTLVLTVAQMRILERRVHYGD